MSDSGMELHWLRTLIAMVTFQFVIGAAFSIVPPVLPLVLPAVGVTDPGALRIWSGFLVGVTPFAAALMSPQWGRWADRMDRRLILFITCVTAATCTSAMVLATHPWQLLLLRFSMGLFGGHVAAALSIVGAAAPAGRLGRALGWMTMGQLAGALLGPLAGGFIADQAANARAPFLAAGIASVLVATTIAFVPAARVSSSPGNRHAGVAGPTVGQRRPQLRVLLLILFLTQSAIMITQPVISLHVLELVGQRPDLGTLAGFAFSVVGLSGLIAAPALGTLADALGPQRLLCGVGWAAVILTLPQGFAHAYGPFVFERFLAGLMVCAMIPMTNTLVGQSVPAHERGRAFGMTTGATFLGAFLGPVAGGLIASHFGLSVVFLISAGLLAVSATGIAVFVWPRLPRVRAGWPLDDSDPKV